MQKEIEDISLLLKQTFEKGAWHGPAVLETLEGIGEAEVFKRLGATHSIIELVAHMAAWKTYTAKKLQGDAGYKVAEEMNFPQLTSWAEALKRLRRSQEELLSALETFPAERLNEPFPGSTTPYTCFTLIHSIIHHDLYHAGQIALIRKALAGQTI